MNRQDLLDNLRISMERGETVTLTLRPIAGCCGDQLVTGKILVLAQHYTSSFQLKVVLRRKHGLPMAIGLTMIRDFEVGVRTRRPERDIPAPTAALPLADIPGTDWCDVHQVHHLKPTRTTNAGE